MKCAVDGYENRKWRKGMINGGRNGMMKTKLYKYLQIKDCIEKESFVLWNRSVVSVWIKLRSGVLGLAIERGRYANVLREDRVCEWCDAGVCEDEIHFVLDCAAWKNDRTCIWG